MNETGYGAQVITPTVHLHTPQVFHQAEKINMETNGRKTVFGIMNQDECILMLWIMEGFDYRYIPFLTPQIYGVTTPGERFKKAAPYCHLE